MVQMALMRQIGPIGSRHMVDLKTHAINLFILLLLLFFLSLSLGIKSALHHREPTNLNIV